MCDPRFVARVREAFAENFAKRGDVGAAAAVTIDGKPVVDLWGGYADQARTRPVRGHNRQCLFVKQGRCRDLFESPR